MADNGLGGITYESFDKLEAFMRDVFIKVGVPAEDAAVCADILIESDKRGIDSHGIGRFKPIYIDRIKEGLRWEYGLSEYKFSFE